MPDDKIPPRPRGFSWGRTLESAFPFRKEGEPAGAPPAPVPPAPIAPPDAADLPHDEPPSIFRASLGLSGLAPPPAAPPLAAPPLAAAPPALPPLAAPHSAPPEDAGLGLDDALLALSKRKPRPIRPRLPDPEPEEEEPPAAPAEEPRWPDTDDRLAAVRRLIPRKDPDPVVPPPVEPEGALPEPAPEPRRSSQRRTAARTVKDERPPTRRFRPVEPATLEAAGLDEGLAEALVVKHLYNNPGASGRALAYDIGLRPTIVSRFLEDLKMRRLAIHRSAAAMGDFYYELTEEGRSVARELQKDSRYAGPAPVPLEQYIESVKAQAISTEHPRRPQLRGAFADLKISEALLDRIGPAVTHGKGMFMFGPPGNGKTSLAERITRAYGSTIYIPHAIYAGGHIIQVYDPAVHVAVDESDIHPGMSGARVDRRWVRCRRPTVVVGGELTLEALDVAFDEVDGVCEAPIQVKANGGTLVIDDFGRQRCRPDELLNRWIVPLEKHVDYIALPGGRKEAFPFECLLIFSTNMEPRDLVDEAFLRRIPYKIEVHGPPEAHFRELVDQQCAELDLDVEEGAVDYLVDEYFTKTGRAMRYCHPRDLMLQVHNLCKFREEPGVVNKETIDQAVLLYFSLL